ncbi:hypothetical protein K435DRAFT_271604 [Dendrothele bispora CBS 962.96]|uniref:Uncharacterized protein n=1 Tax=Dendrothele bispora (strain CBS 962.96) TaxID=1314807 RepID=A0A4V6T595_DENBC|nr:hypothetical protein K435DRAFT_271604 [Dendrothele bispora CBS 962.96]
MICWEVCETSSDRYMCSGLINFVSMRKRPRYIGLVYQFQLQNNARINEGGWRNGHNFPEDQDERVRVNEAVQLVEKWGKCGDIQALIEEQNLIQRSSKLRIARRHFLVPFNSVTVTWTISGFTSGSMCLVELAAPWPRSSPSIHVLTILATNCQVGWGGMETPQAMARLGIVLHTDW